MGSGGSVGSGDSVVAGWVVVAGAVVVGIMACVVNTLVDGFTVFVLAGCRLVFCFVDGFRVVTFFVLVLCLVAGAYLVVGFPVVCSKVLDFPVVGFNVVGYHVI